LSKTGFLSHNFGSRYAGKSVKGSKDADFSLSQKIAQCFGAQGQVNSAKNALTSPY